MNIDPEKKREAAPRAQEFAEVESTMDPRRQSPDGAPDQGERQLEELVNWDELSPERLRMLSADPVQGPRLDLLRRVEELLHAAVGPGEPCPTAEELYDFGRGPGYEPLAFERRRAIAGHLERCAECAGHVRSLAASPPLPLDVSPPTEAELRRSPAQPTSASRSLATRREDAAGPFAAADLRSLPAPTRAEPVSPPEAAREDPFAEPGPAEISAGGESRSPRPDLGPHWMQQAQPAGEHSPWRGRRRWLALLATAAAAAIFALLWPEPGRESGAAGAGTLPGAELLRGAAGGPLYFPRDKVLFPPVELGPSGSRLHYAERPTFELEPVPGATLYRVILSRHDGGAFAEGREIDVLQHEDPSRLESERALGPGFYTWEAWAIVGGLDRRLGAHDFQVVENAELCRAIETLDDFAAIRLLHDQGFWTDARALARDHLPPSPEREAYLRILPGR